MEKPAAQRSRLPVATAVLLLLALGAAAPYAFRSPAADHRHDVPAAAASPGVVALDVFAHDDTIDLLLLVETTAGKELRHLRSVDGAVTWSDARTIDRAGRDIVDHHRGMDPQLAARGDDIVVLWTMPGPSPWGAGALATAVSRDAGRTWTSSASPSDVRSGELGHSFLELAADPAGTFAAFRLDSRDGAQGLRTSVSSDAGESWSPTVSIASGTCECCWNKAVALSPGSFAVLYRDREPRDMALAVSHDGGTTWHRQGRVGAFDWAFDGCPHVGGGVAHARVQGAERLHAVVWSGAPGRLGLHVQRSRSGGAEWSEPLRLGSERARHADIAADGDALAVVWDEPGADGAAIFASRSHDGGASWTAPVRLSQPEWIATHPLVVAAHGRFVAFWTEQGRGEERLGWRSAVLADARHHH